MNTNIFKRKRRISKLNGYCSQDSIIEYIKKIKPNAKKKLDIRLENGKSQLTVIGKVVHRSSVTSVSPSSGCYMKLRNYYDASDRDVSHQTVDGWKGLVQES